MSARGFALLLLALTASRFCVLFFEPYLFVSEEVGAGVGVGVGVSFGVCVS